ncbi:multiheme c-type cytochrome [Seleniivibrio woodruffii]|uniref:OmcA/MtrC family decaheme c-type cytochrome n=1 Tax=Seleniivibrio woodruffii TaxID=1078050 RepID=A0A4R1K5A1_9BACT|nr:hypothetical protein [Seleniivibrio woodruffii]TCK59355.1 OmcA/MtrC family decaheme c-type cytochrome [Seleniivibrio woodruffii]TVZ35606.1 OmcA/MtrC family decaheme c-type cytochrome [Seleniivibrio woodruffii]
MSRRILFLLMLALTCSFMLVGCGGSDGSDGANGADADTAAIIAELKAQLESGAITIAQYEDAIAALEAELASTGKITAVESCATCHADGKTNDPAHGGDYLVKGHQGANDSAPVVREVRNFKTAWSANITDVVVNGDNSLTVDITITSTGAAFNPAADFVSFTINRYQDDNTLANYDRWVNIAPATAANFSNRVAVLDSGNNYTVTIAADANLTPYLAETLMIGATSSDADGANAASDIYRGNLKDGFNVQRLLVAGVDYDVNSSNNPRNYVSDKGSAPSCIKCHGDNEFNYHHNNVLRADADDCVTCHIGGASYDGTNQPAYVSNSRSSLVGRVHGVHASAMYESGKDTDGNALKGYPDEDGFNIGFPSNMSECSVCHTTADQLANATDNSKFRLSLCVTCHGSTPWETIPMNDTLKSIHSSYTVAANDNVCVTCHTGAAGAIAPTSLEDIHAGNLHNMEVSLGKNIAYEIQSVTITGNTGKVTWRAYNTNTSTNYDVLKRTTAANDAVFVGTSPSSADAARAFQSYATSMVIGFYTGDDLTNQGITSQGGQPTLNVAVGSGNTSEVGTTDVFETTFTIPATVTATKGIVAIQGVPVVWSGGTGYLAIVDSVTKNFNRDNSAATARRSAVDINLCLNCHTDFLGHGHNRINNIELCVTCHNANATDKSPRTTLAAQGYNVTADGKTEESYDLKVMLHNIHSATDTDTAYMVYRTRGIYSFRGESAQPANFGVGGTASMWQDVQVHYPRAITSCTACHPAGTFNVADQTKAVAVTVEQGANLASHADDTVIGPNAAACTSCHKGNISDAAAIRAHATTFGYKTNKSTKNEILQLAQ